MKRGLAGLAAFAMLTGCAASHRAVQSFRAAERKAADAMQTAPVEDPNRGSPVVTRSADMYFGGKAFQRRRGDELPARTDTVLVRSDGDVDLRSFASLVTKASGIPIALNIAAAKGTGAQQAATAMAVLWDDSLAGLLDLASAKFGVDWEYRNGVIAISDERTETFVLHALPAINNVDASLSTKTGGSQSASSGSSGGGAPQTTGASSFGAGQAAVLDVWRDMSSALAVIIGERGRFAVNPSNGTITVTGSPVMRSDPDVIMIGEIRDRTTAALALGASMTGHQVWSTLHCTTAHAIPMHLADLGADRSIIFGSDELEVAIAQRLAALLCPSCRVPLHQARPQDGMPAPADLVAIAGEQACVEGPGCEACKGRGIAGRTVLAEVIRTDPDYLMILNERGVGAARRFTRQRGEPSIADIAIRKAARGEISAYEIAKLMDVPPAADPPIRAVVL